MGLMTQQEFNESYSNHFEFSLINKDDKLYGVIPDSILIPISDYLVRDEIYLDSYIGHFRKIQHLIVRLKQEQDNLKDNRLPADEQSAQIKMENQHDELIDEKSAEENATTSEATPAKEASAEEETFELDEEEEEVDKEAEEIDELDED